MDLRCYGQKTYPNFVKSIIYTVWNVSINTTSRVYVHPVNVYTARWVEEQGAR